MRSILICLLTLLIFAGTVHAARTPEEFDATMFVEGNVSVSDVGRVTAYRIDTKVDAQIQTLLDRVVSRWLFEPMRIDEVATAFDTAMRVTLRGQAKDGEMVVRVENVEFTGSNVAKQGEAFDRSIRAVEMTPPRFPLDAMRAGLQGQTMIALRIDRYGQVIDAAVSHTDLVGLSSSEKMLARARAPLERAALQALRQWRFELSEHAIPEGASDTSVLVPVTYSMSRKPGDKGWMAPGRWSYVTRGQKQRIPWLRDGEVAANLSANGAGSTLPVKLRSAPDDAAL